MKQGEKQGSVLLFDKKKYTWLIAGLVVTAIGFLLMIGGASEDPEVFDDAVFSFRRLTLAPILVLAGYAMQIYAIMKKTTNVPEGSGRGRDTMQQKTQQKTEQKPQQKGQQQPEQHGRQAQTRHHKGKKHKPGKPKN